MTRPAIYLPALTDEEIIRYVGQYEASGLETSLASRLSSMIDERDEATEDLDIALAEMVYPEGCASC